MHYFYIWDLDQKSYPSIRIKGLYILETLSATALVKQHAEPFARTALLLGIMYGDERYNQHSWHECIRWKVPRLLDSLQFQL